MISLVVALPAEARPIVRRFGLERDPRVRSRRYRGRDLELIVSGVGARAASTAVEELAAEAGSRAGGWVNFGIAGHRDLPLGAVRLAHKVVDVESGRSWYPPAPFATPCPGAVVRSVAAVELAPADDALYEMEAAGFCRSAVRVATAETVQVLKVVSDNRATPPTRLTARSVEELVEGSLPTLEQLIGEMAVLVGGREERMAPPAGLDGFKERWRFTVTQERQLDRLLRRLGTLGRPVVPEALEKLDSARAVLTDLRSRL